MRERVPVGVPPGVLHTPRDVGQTLNPEWDSSGTPWDSKHGNTEEQGISGVPLILNEVGQAGQQVSHKVSHCWLLLCG
jgi:hypothetical protein